MWATPQAQKLLSDNLAAGTDDEVALPPPMLEWLEQAQKGKAGSKTTAMASFPDDEQLRLQYMGKLGPNEFLLRLAKDTSTILPPDAAASGGASLLPSNSGPRSLVQDRDWQSNDDRDV